MAPPPACSDPPVWRPPPGEDVYPPGLTLAMYFVYPLFIVLNFASIAVFLYYKPYYARLRVRSNLIVYVTSLGLLFQLQVGGLDVILNFVDDPCWLRLFFFVMVSPLVFGQGIAKLLIGAFSYQFGLLAQQYQRNKPWEQESGDGDSGQSRTVSKSILTTFSSLRLALGRVVRSTNTQPEDEATAEAIIWSLRFMISPYGLWGLFLVLLVPWGVLVAILLVAQPAYRNGCKGCVLFPNAFLPFISIAAFEFLIGIFLAYKMRHQPDPIGLLRESSLQIAAGILVIGSVIFAFVISDWFQIPQIIAFYLLLFIQTIYQVVVARIKEGPPRAQQPRAYIERRKQKRAAAALAKKEAKVANSRSGNVSPSNAPSTPTHGQTSSVQSGAESMELVPASLAVHEGGLNLITIRKDEALNEQFEKHLIAEFGIESLKFLQDLDDWKRKFPDLTPSARTARARKLYRLYVDIDGLFPINIPSSIYNELRALLGPGAPPLSDVDPKVFDSAAFEIEKMLNDGAVMRFIAKIEKMSGGNRAVMAASV